jgi:tetratricopeptide (TPR) repeat protein
VAGLEEAIRTYEEAVAVHRQLARDDPEYLPVLASGLNNLGTRLAEMFKHADAVAPTREALEISRRLAQENPREYVPLLAVSLYNMGVRHSNTGRPVESAETLREAVGRYRQLVTISGPAEYGPQLAMALGTLGEQLGALGHHEEMLATSQEGLDILRPFAESDPGTHLPEFAKRQLLYAEMRLHARLDLPAAVNGALGAVDVYWPVAEQHTYYIPVLKRALSTLADILDALGRHADARDFRRQRDSIPDAGTPRV